jgi:hypothetical protein
MLEVLSGPVVAIVSVSLVILGMVLFTSARQLFRIRARNQHPRLDDPLLFRQSGPMETRSGKVVSRLQLTDESMKK